MSTQPFKPWIFFVATLIVGLWAATASAQGCRGGGGMGMGGGGMRMGMGGMGMSGGMMQGGGGMCMGQMGGGGSMMGNQLGMQMNGFGGGAGQISYSRSSSVAGPGSMEGSNAKPSLRGEQLRRSVLAEFDADSNGKLEGSELKAMRIASAQSRKQSSRR